MNQRNKVDARLLELQGGDPFDYVLGAAETHRAVHGPTCGLYSAGPHVMRLAAAFVRSASARAKNILDIGTGFGYSALWLADAAGPGARIEAIDRFDDHIAAARRFAEVAGVSERIRFLVGDAGELLRQLVGPYDLVHDDAWFAAEPDYFDRVVELLKPGGLLTMPNWFLLTDAIAGKHHRRWARFAGPVWEEATQAYARRLANDRRMHVTWTVSPPLGIAVKQDRTGADVEGGL